ncbi:MAG TPA: hypothetical protein VF989_08510 [Polyangiaceae bacterium]
MAKARTIHVPTLRRWLARAVKLLALVAVVCIPGQAKAHAPMCDENAQSIEAPPPIYPSSDATLSAVFCEEGQGARTAPSGRSGSFELRSAAPAERALLGGLTLAPVSSVRAVQALAVDGAPRFSHAARVERPPQDR